MNKKFETGNPYYVERRHIIKIPSGTDDKVLCTGGSKSKSVRYKVAKGAVWKIRYSYANLFLSVLIPMATTTESIA